MAAKTHANFAGDQLTDTDPALRRDLMRLIDQTIADTSTCRLCNSPVELHTTETDQTYDAWLVCTNPSCGRRHHLA